MDARQARGLQSREPDPPSFTGYAGTDMLTVSRDHGLEGIVAKRLNSAYQPGRRSPDWRKVKNVYRQEFVVNDLEPLAARLRNGLPSRA